MKDITFVQTVKEILPLLVERIEMKPIFDEKETEILTEYFRFWIQLPNDDERYLYWNCLESQVIAEKDICIKDDCIYLMGRQAINKYNAVFCNDFAIRILLIVLKKVMEKTEKAIIKIEKDNYNKNIKTI